MKATPNRQFSVLAARTLKIVGILLVVSFLLDTLVMSIPFNVAARVWQIAFTTQIVERGIVPMVGMALLFTGFWIDSTTGGNQDNSKPVTDFRFWVFALASFLGLMYLLLFPLHLNNIRLQEKDELAQIEQQAVQAETQLDTQISSDQFKTQVSQRQTQLKNQLTSLLQNQAQLDQALTSQQVPDQLKDILKQSKDNPKVIDEFLNQQAQQVPTQLRTQIRSQRQQLETQTKEKLLKSSLQTGMSSLLLAIGYITLGWTGLKSIGVFRGSRS